jgi:predicted Rossmann fold nucleotide-binding protein DprA/Smf involved in DNA uptake
MALNKEEMFCGSRNVDSPEQGTNRLIKEGAKLIMDPTILLEEKRLIQSTGNPGK